jgi:hypothetical protein
MALYLNLYHEIQKQKLKRQRDPFKIGIMVMLMVAVGFIAYYFWRLESVQKSTRELLRVQSEWKATEPKQKVALARRDELDLNVKLRDAIVHKIENRFYWAPLLNSILRVTPPEVQITGFGGEALNTGPKKITVSVSGISTGAQPRNVAEKLRTTLQNELALHYQQVTTVFGTLDDNAETIQYQGRTLPTSTFVINITCTAPDVDDVDKASVKTPTRTPKS